MTKELFKNLIIVLDKEIKAYTELRDLFAEKREILKRAKPDDLGVVDNKILAVNELLTKLNKSRQKIGEKLGDPNANMSRYIALAEELLPDYVEALEARKVKICKTFQELAQLNRQNVELLKHGLIISNKMLETIINSFAPQGSYYNGAGKTDTHEVDMWTINEEI